MFDRILVAVDGSSTSNRGLDEAIQLASDQKAELCVLHVVDDLPITLALKGRADASEPLLTTLRSSGKKTLAHAVARVRKRGLEPRPVFVETAGRSVAEVITEQARKLKADLIILGTHGRRGVARLVMGSDAEGVISAASVPVLLVRSRTHSRRTALRGGARKAA
jgi:nucleotide-binding universal stress UspA family protein